MIEILKADLEIKHFDKDGNMLDYYYGPSKSWVKNFYQYVLAQSCGIFHNTTTYGTEVVGTGGNTRTSANIILYGFADSRQGPWADTSATIGCVIGTGTASAIESFTDIAMASKISDGIGAGQMQHGAGSLAVTTATGGTIIKNTIARTFTNNSGGVVNVAECGLYGILVYDDLNINDIFLLNRDTFGNIAVTNGNSLYVGYNIKISLPEALV